jgi:hypothetical protein
MAGFYTNSSNLLLCHSSINKRKTMNELSMWAVCFMIHPVGNARKMSLSKIYIVDAVNIKQAIELATIEDNHFAHVRKTVTATCIMAIEQKKQ